MSDAEIIAALAKSLKPFAEWELPPHVEQAIGTAWLDNWRRRAQKALRDAGHLDGALCRE